jgi:hypothetical protein
MSDSFRSVAPARDRRHRLPLIFETTAVLRYLMANFSPDLVDAYVRHSLRHERRLWDRIQMNIANRGGEVLPIENRMLLSLGRAARVAGMALGSIDLRNRGPWGGKDLRQKAEAIGWSGAYDGVFGGMSHSIHGSWHDLCSYHLEADEGRFAPALKWSWARPQTLFALGTLVTETNAEVFSFLGGELAVDQIGNRLVDVDAGIREADDAHERYLGGKLWPEI